jgi:putative peptidoglycan lipid II flippase
MAAALYGLQLVLASWFDRGALRYIAVAILVGAGLAVYFPLVWILGGTDREELKSLLRRRRPYTDAA